MEPETKVEREHYWVYDREVPDGWREGNLMFVRSPNAPGGVTHHVFVYNPQVSSEKRRNSIHEDGPDTFWRIGTLHVRERTVTVTPWVDADLDKFLEETGLFSEYEVERKVELGEYR